MIKKETIETLKEISCSMCDYGAPNMDLCDISKCDTRDAIKALEQEPSERKAEDCISREEFIEFMISAWEEMSGDDAMQMCIDKARLMPSVYPKSDKQRVTDYVDGFAAGMKDTIPKSVLEDIKAEIDELPSELTYDGRRMVRRSRVFEIIDNHINGKEQGENT